MSYDPRDHGADCAHCFLYPRRDGPPVGPEINADATAIAVGEAPGADEVEEGRPFVGQSGQELMRALNSLGFRRSDISITNALCCRPPGNELGRLVHSLKALNKQREKSDLEPLPSPTECCRPRLFRELAGYKNFLLLGRTAADVVLGARDYSIFDIRGGPLEGFFDTEMGFTPVRSLAPATARPVRVLPTVHPSLVLHQRRYTRVFRVDVGRALRWFSGQRKWVEPDVLIRPSPAQLEEFLFRQDPVPGFFAHDFETEVKDALEAKIHCLGVGTVDRVCVVPFVSKQYFPRGFYTPSERVEILELFRRFFTDPNIIHVGHNSKIFDRVVMKAQWGFEPAKHWDTLALHRSVESELPHNLYYVGSTWTDIDRAWKADHAGTDAETDEQLFEYNADDVVITARVVEPLVDAVKLREQQAVVKKDHRVLDICTGMHELGMLVDPTRRDQYDHEFLRQILRYRTICREAIEVASFNPGSVPQVQDVLFERWRLPPVKVSEKTGDPSTDDDVLREYRINQPLSKAQKVFIEALRRYRLFVKLRGTEIIKFRRAEEPLPTDPLWEDVEESAEDRKNRKKRDEKKVGLLLADGRVHSTWNQLTTTGRLNSMDPNLQNRRGKYRDMFIPQPFCETCGEPHVFVGADMDQLELRFGAAWWGLETYLRIFARGGDPHAETALTTFGSEGRETLARAEAWAAAERKKPKEFPDWNRMRDFSKRFYYACQYAAEDETVHQVITSVEDDEGRLVYANVSRMVTAQRRAALLEANPELPAGWDRDVARFRAQHFIAEPVWGRRRDFLDGEKLNEIVNFSVQSGGEALVHDATFDLLQEIPFQKWCRYSGLVHQGHDSLLMEVPASKAAWVKATMEACMKRDGRPFGLPMTFTAGAKVGKNWKETK